MDNSSTRLVAIFFYGLYMDAELLREKGIEIRRPRAATVMHRRIVVREKAMLLREKHALAHGMLYELTHAEIEILYAHQPAYRAEALLASDGTTDVAAICMVHVDPPLNAPVDDIYARKFGILLEQLGLPLCRLIGYKTEKFDSFKSDLIDLCNLHGVTLGASGTEKIVVWDQGITGYALDVSGLADKTGNVPWEFE